jgi:hypothetical protein
MWTDLGFLLAGTYGFYVEAWSPNPDKLAVRQYGELTVYPYKKSSSGNPSNGYVCRGANAMKNNRADVVGPANLSNLKTTYLGDFTNENYPGATFVYPDNLRVSGDGKYYYGLTRGYYFGYGYPPTSDQENESQLALVDDKGNTENVVDGGLNTVLCDSSIVSQYWDHSYSVYHIPAYMQVSEGTSWGLYSFSPDLNTNAVISGGEWWSSGNMSWSGSGCKGELVEIYDCLPLPGNYILSSERFVKFTGPYENDYIFSSRIIYRDAETLEPASWVNELVVGSSPAVQIYGASTSPNGHIYYVRYSKLVCLDPYLNELWTAEISQMPLTEPSIADNGTIFVGTVTGVYAFDPDGHNLWFKGITPTTDFAVTTDGNLIVASTNYQLMCLAYETGETMWSAPIGENYGNNILVDAEDKIYMNTDDYLYIFNKSGKLLDSRMGPYSSYSNASNLVLGPTGKLTQVWGGHCFAQFN